MKPSSETHYKVDSAMGPKIVGQAWSSNRKQPRPTSVNTSDHADLFN